MIRLRNKLAKNSAKALANSAADQEIELGSGDEFEDRKPGDDSKGGDEEDYIDFLPFELDDFDQSEWICERMKKDAKVLERFKSVVSLDDVQKLQVPDSPERKMVLALFYAFGSFCSKASNPIDARYNLQYQKNLFQKFWTMFPNLVPHASMIIVRDGTRKGPLMARCRDAFLCPFRRQQIKLKTGKSV